MSLFVAVIPDTEARVRVGEAIRACRRRTGALNTSIRWVEPEKLHLTVAFLGNVHPGVTNEIVKALKRAWLQVVFRITLSSAGIFPAAGIPKVLWIGVGNGKSEVGTLREEVKARLEPLGLSLKRNAYRPHLTVGRVKQATSGAGAQIRDALGSIEIPRMQWTVERVLLYESRFSSTGSSYSLLVKAPLRHTGGGETWPLS